MLDIDSSVIKPLAQCAVAEVMAQMSTEPTLLRNFLQQQLTMYIYTVSTNQLSVCTNGSEFHVWMKLQVMIARNVRGMSCVPPQEECI